MGRKRGQNRIGMPQVHLDLRTPFAPALEAAVVALYEVCGLRCVSRQLHVCDCKCCMTDSMRKSIIETPNALLSVEQIREYSNSAHGTVENHDDLVVLLPRYAELLAQGLSVDYNDSDEILWRFGATIKSGAMPAPVCDAYFDWAGAYFRHAVFADARELESDLFTYGALKLLLSGGMTGDQVIALLNESVARDVEGALTTSWFATHVFITRSGGAADPKLDFIWTYGLQAGAAEAVLEWFKGPDYHAALERALLYDLPYDRFMACKIVLDWFAARL